MEPTHDNLRFFVETCKRNAMSASDTHGLLVRAWGNVVTERTVYNWLKEDKSKLLSTSSELGSMGCPRSSRTKENMDTVHELVAANAHSTIDELVYATGISHGSIHAILHDDLQFTSVLSRWVPHYLDANQRQQRVHSAADMLKFFQLHRRDISNRLVVVDEKWIYFRDIGTKNSNRAWVPQDDKRNRPTIPRRLQHEKKRMFLFAFCFNGKFVLHMLPHSTTVDGAVYLEFLTKVHHSFHRRVRNPLDWNEIILQHDNARPHTAAPVREFLESKGVRLL